MKGLSYDSPLSHHAGAIREAITLDFSGETDYTHVGLYAQGLNGQQANAGLHTSNERHCSCRD